MKDLGLTGVRAAGLSKFVPPGYRIRIATSAALLALAACDPFSVLAPKGIGYEVSIDGTSDAGLKQALSTSSELVAQESHPPKTREALRARAQADIARLGKAMASEGYYDGRAEVTIDDDVSPAKVALTVRPETVYTLKDVVVAQPDGTPPVLAGRMTPLLLGLPVGRPAVAKPILDAQAKILKILTTGGYPLAKVDAPQSVIDTATHTMKVTYIVHPGDFAWFGETSIGGLKDLDPQYVDNRLKWHPGETYDSAPVDKTKQALIGTGLFSTVDIHPADSVADDGAIPMVIDATERDKHSIGATAEYNTSQALLANVFWEDRDLFGGAEKLRLSAEIGNQEKNAVATFTQPDTFRVDQSLRVTTGFSDETVDPYTSRKEFFGSSLERPFADHLTGSFGFTVAHANLDTDMGAEHYDLLSLPVAMKFDNSDDLLNPVKGYRASLTITPSAGTSATTLHFVTVDAKASAYQSLDDADHLVLAEFARLGSIDGNAFGDLPRDLRFYSGGGGSLRGYAYQHAGPLDFDEKPTGGKSVLETGAELRIPVYKGISVVPFAEAGSYYEKPVPELTHTLLYDAGIGARYMTAVGPLRFDIAAPLKRRPGDSPIQIYASIGQAF